MSKIIDCKRCDGLGYLQYSDCCNEIICGTHRDICSLCEENCDKAECDECGGIGEIEVWDKRDYKEDQEIDRWQERSET